MKTFLILILLAAAGGGYWYWQKQHDAPTLPVAKATRETVVNTLSTNGKVEPIEFQEVHAEAQGLITQLLVKEGDSVTKGQVLVRISETGLREELEAAQAREAQANADLQTLQQGGRASELAELDGQVTRLQSERETAQATSAALKRLVQKDAVTKAEAEQAANRVHALDVEIAVLQKRRGSIVGKNEVTSAQAKVREAAANVASVKAKIRLGAIVAPLAGTVYSLPAKNGAYLSAGDPVASIGRLNPVRVRVYVDEPEMGRVAVKQPVRITWDAQQGKEWSGIVERKPTEIVSLGTRQVGEVLCTIANPSFELVPGTNVNAFIQTSVSQNALVIPKAALRNDDGVGVYLFEDGVLRWTRVKTGVSSALKVEALDGIKEGEAVVLQTDTTLKNGLKIVPSWQ